MKFNRTDRFERLVDDPGSVGLVGGSDLQNVAGEAFGSKEVRGFLVPHRSMSKIPLTRSDQLMETLSPTSP